MDGANLNAAGGRRPYPGELGADVSHLNLHKTFCIPARRRRAGRGSDRRRAHLAPFLPGRGKAGWPGGERSPIWQPPRHPADPVRLDVHPHDGRRWPARSDGGGDPQRQLHRQKLAPHYPVPYTGHGGFVAHEFIVDVRPSRTICAEGNMDVISG